MKDFVEDYFSTRRKKNYHCQESLKNEEKMVSTSQKISFTNKLFLWKLFLPNSNNGCCYEKAASTLTNLWKNRKNWCPLAEIWFVFKTDFPLISIIVSTSRKNSQKQYYFQQTKNSFPLARIKHWLKNLFLLKNKLLPLVPVACCLRKWKKMVSTCQKTVLIS